MTKLWAWDELGMTTESYDEHEAWDLVEGSVEGGWELSETLPNGTQVWRTDRHFALQCRANSIEEAILRFSTYDLFREYY